MEILSYSIEAFIHFEEDSIEKLMTLCEQAIESITDNDRAIYKLKTAIHELIINSIEHGYHKKEGKITIHIKKGRESVIFEISDEGSGLDLKTVDLEHTLEDIESATSRGWGLFITSKLSQEMVIAPNTPSGTKITVVVPV